MFLKTRDSFKAIQPFLRTDGYVRSDMVAKMNWAVVPIECAVWDEFYTERFWRACGEAGVRDVQILADDNRLQLPLETRAASEVILRDLHMEYGLGPYILTTANIQFIIIAFSDCTLIAGPERFCSTYLGFPASDAWRRFGEFVESLRLQGVDIVWAKKVNEIYRDLHGA